MINSQPMPILRRLTPVVFRVMKKFVLLYLCLLFNYFASAQDYSNKGKEFWLGYGNHEQMFGGNGQGMDVYITSDVNTSALVEIPGVGFSQSVTITANQVTKVTIPNSAVLDLEGKSNRGIHIKADRPVVVYAHIYFQSVSGATLCLPVNTLGQEYYSVNYTQVAQATLNANSLSFFFVVATEDNTNVEITPSAPTQGGKPAGVPFSVTLNRGEVYQVLSSSDLTGSTIKSTNNGTGCNRIAVFSGSGRIGIGCGANVSSSDNLIQQMYPSNTWGKKYITIPSATRPTNYYRVIRPDATSVVTVNGSVIPDASFTNGIYYEFENTQTNVIESDKPIFVAQYFTSQSCAEAVPYGDPEMIYLNPLEQTINDATLASMRLINVNNNSHYINVVLKNDPGIINSFKIDGNPYSTFSTVPQDPGFAYAQIPVNFGTHRLTCDSGFNAIAYGFAQFESYGYSAGTNLRDMYQYISINNVYGTVDFPAGCKGSPFNFSMVFPYQPAQIKWQFNGLFPDTTLVNPIPDSSWVVNGRTIYVFKLKRNYEINSTGTFPISVVPLNPTATGCSGEQEIDYDLQIFERPAADFSFLTNGCLSDSVRFTDLTTNTGGRSVIKTFWDFGDGQLSSLKSPAHKYATSQAYDVKFALLTDVGCLSDTIAKTVSLAEPPVASFTVTAPYCNNTPINFVSTSTTNGGVLAKSTWDFGDGTIESANDVNPRTHIYSLPGTYTVKLIVQSDGGCESLPFLQQVTINTLPLADFKVSDICLPSGAAQFTNQSSIADGTDNLLAYKWGFADPNATAGNPDSSMAKDPVHIYSGTGPYNVKLFVTSNNGCTTDTTIALSNISPQPKADFTIPAQICAGDTVDIQFNAFSTDGTPFTSLFIDRGTGSFDTSIVNLTAGASTISYQYTNSVGGNHVIRVYGETAKGCISDTVSKTIKVNAIPIANFGISTPGCEGKAIKLSDASVPNAGNIVQWSWDLGDGNIDIRNSAASFDYTYASVSSYPVTLKVMTDVGCSSVVLTKPVNISPMPVANFNMPKVCLSDTRASFSDSSFIADGSENQFTYLWNFGNGNTSAQKNPVQNYSSTGVYPVNLTVTSKDGCTATITKSFTVNGSLPKADFQVKDAANLCSNKEVSIVNTSTVDFGNVTKVEVYWDYANDPTAKIVDDAPSANKEYKHLYTVPGTALTQTRSVKLVAYSGLSCENEVTKTITLNSTPQVVFGSMPPVCEDVEEIILTQGKEANALPGNGLYSGNGVTADGRFHPSSVKAGMFTLRYTYTSTPGCVAFNEQVISVSPSPKVNAGPDKVVLEGGSVQLSTPAGEDLVRFRWSPPDGLSDPSARSPIATPFKDVLYTLTATNSQGCSGTDQVFVKVLLKPIIPNTFTPNGDGYNDKWEIFNLGAYPGCIVEVYNTAGQLMFRSIGYTSPWDGTLNGRPLPVGTYYYAIDPKNGRPKIAGYVTIIR